MEKGQKCSSDEKEGKKKRDESPAPEDGHKCRVCRFPLLVALLQLLLGVAVTAVAFLMLAVSPSLLARETPHWAGIIVSISMFAWSLILLHAPQLFPSRCRPSSPHCMSVLIPISVRSSV